LVLILNGTTTAVPSAEAGTGLPASPARRALNLGANDRAFRFSDPQRGLQALAGVC
jgi:hypothetical protein